MRHDPPFEFATPRVVFGAGVVVRAGEIARTFGTRALVVTGKSTARAARIRQVLDESGVATELFSVDGEPSIDVVVAGAAQARAAKADVIVAIGGGSALDSGKAIAALAANDGDVFDYLETIGRARALERPARPVVAVPTTAGTGSEVTRNAVVSSPQHRVKVSLRHVSMLPAVAIVDPELAIQLPADVTATTGLDALTQLIEPFVSHRHTPVVDALALDGIRRVAASFRVAVTRGDELSARSDMALAALWSGMCLSNAALGAVHGLAGPLGGLLGAPHSALCAALLPHVMAVNLAALRRARHSAVIERYDGVARTMTGSERARADDGVRWTSDLVADLGILSLAAHGLTSAGIEEAIDPAMRANSMKGNPIELSRDEIKEVLERARG